MRGKQRYKCKECGINFVIGDARTNEKIVAKKAMCVILYSLGKTSYNMLANVFDTWQSLVYRWIVEAGAKLPEHAIFGEVKHMEFDEMWPFVKSKNKLWVIKAVDRCQRRTVVWVLGNRDSATFQRLYEKVKHLTDCTFYTDNWDAFAKSLPLERHVIGKAERMALSGTIAIPAIT